MTPCTQQLQTAREKNFRGEAVHVVRFHVFLLCQKRDQWQEQRNWYIVPYSMPRGMLIDIDRYTLSFYNPWCHQKPFTMFQACLHFSLKAICCCCCRIAVSLHINCLLPIFGKHQVYEERNSVQNRCRFFLSSQIDPFGDQTDVQYLSIS